jgi:hypothetical protein
VTLAEEPLALGDRAARDSTGLGMRLGQDELSLAPRLVLHLLRGALGGDERGAQKRFELAVALQLALELLDPLGEVGALTPHLLEALDDVTRELVDMAAPVAEQPLAQLGVADLGRCEWHGFAPFVSGGDPAARSRPAGG